MSRPARSAPRLPRAAGGAAALLLATAALGALPTTGPVLQAVASYGVSLPSVPGVRVVQNLPSVRAAVVRGDRSALARLAAARGVRAVEPDGEVRLTSAQDSAGTGRLASEGLGGAAGQPGAGAGVRVAVIDTGVSDTAALSRAGGRLVDAVDTSALGHGGPVVTGGVFDDGYGHGTFMADVVAGGPLAATGNRAIGVAPAATVLVVKVAEADGTTRLSQVVAGLDWVAAHHATVDVASLSLAQPRPRPAYGADPLTDAVERVHDAGVTMVVSAGNDGTLGDPGFDPKVLTVGAADLATGTTAAFSASGRVHGVLKPDLVASGVHVLGLLPPASVLAADPGTAHLPGGLFRGSGTSQAAAVTSGVAALLLSAHPEATPAQVKASLRGTAQDLPGHRDGAGLLRTTTDLLSGPDGRALDGSGRDLTGEGSFNASSWGASSWGASSWGASSWGASSWGASSWGASSWGASSWGASSWGASSWGASSWGASSWGASSWGGQNGSGE